MKRSHWLWCGGGLLALVVVLLVAGVPAVSALLIAALLACPLMMLITLGGDPWQLGQSPADRSPANSGKASPSQMPVDKESLR